MVPTNTKLRERADMEAEAKPLTVGRGNKARPMRVLSRGQGGWVIGTRNIETDTHKFVPDTHFQGRVEMGAVVTQAADKDGKPIPGHYDCL